MCMQLRLCYFIQENEICQCDGASILKIAIAKCEKFKKRYKLCSVFPLNQP